MKTVLSSLTACIVACASVFADRSFAGDVCRVTFKGQSALPSFGPVAGIWFWSYGDAQLLLLGFEGELGWRSVACGAGWELEGKSPCPKDAARLRARTTRTP